MSEKKASVHWEGAGKAGQGQISTETGALDRYPYGFASRFGDDRKGTNPEEILGAAHAACFTMAFSFAAEKAGAATESVDTTASVRLSKDGDGFVIDRIALTLKAKVPGCELEIVPDCSHSLLTEQSALVRDRALAWLDRVG